MVSDAPERTLELASHELAGRHALGDGAPDPAPSWSKLTGAKEWLARARETLADPEPHAVKAAEWLLDNEYLVHRAILQIEQDLPPQFYSQLPALANSDGERLPRVLAIARGLLVASHLQLSRPMVSRFIEVYQSHAPLTIAELWALPTALRLACLEILVAAIERLLPSLAAPFATPDTPHILLNETECVARSLGNLRVISSISWKDVFVEASRVEAILLRDPAEIYARMDFDTADRYRRVVEALSRATTHSETEVAERLVAFAQRFEASDLRRGHVGYWLIDAGQEEFEHSLGYRVPSRVRVRRWLASWGTGSYAVVLGSATLAALALPGLYLAELAATPAMWLAAMAVAALPASVLGVTMVHWALTQILPPRVLPKLDLESGIPIEFKAAVVVPSLASGCAEVEHLLENLEGHYLGNRESAVEFILLTDFPDADSETLPGDDLIVEALVAGVARLNLRYAGSETGPFHVLHRPRLYNPSESCWMARERKRGKLEDFNRLLQGDPAATFSLHAGEAERLRGIRFVVTLDADTILPRGSVQRLVGILAHPLNRAQFDEKTGRVIGGYTVVQPRVEIDPASGNGSLFARLFAGDTAIDIYSRAVSDVYQDVFGSGIYVGKGIYDVDAFARSLEGCVPENALASHDLFEGIHGRAALATDVVLYESFPRRYLEFTRRLHRWIRGDWQLLPWLLRRVPGAGGVTRPNRLSAIDRWKIFDNLRRSLVAPSLVMMLAAGWLVLPGNPWLWTTLGVLAPAGHLFTDLVTGFARGRRRGSVRSTLRRFSDHAGRWILLVVFLPSEAWIAIDAIVRSCTRLFVTRRGLLEWTTAAHTAKQFEKEAGRAVEWRAMRAGPIAAILIGVSLVWLRPSAFASASLLLAAWLVSPEVAFRLGFARKKSQPPLSSHDHRSLRLLARRTWLFFETFAGPEDQWLPPDNFQEDPGAVVAHRTSPTNIGMLLLSTLTASDLGYLGTGELVSRFGRVFETLKRLERHRGHFLNWFDTRTLVPLEPRYVSTVDSGNLAASLVALKEGCFEIAAGPAFRPARWDGLIDMLMLLEEDLERLFDSDRREQLREMLRAMETHAESARDDTTKWLPALEALSDGEGAAFEQELRKALGEADRGVELSVLRDIRIWLDRVDHQVREMNREIEAYSPWTRLLFVVPDSIESLAKELSTLLPLFVPIDEAPDRIAQARERLTSYGEGGEAREWRDKMMEALTRGERGLEGLRVQLLERATEAESFVLAMDFKWLYDGSTRLFHIGYNVSADQMDSHHYDLLASEARIASFLAIAKGDVPVEHWFHLGRGITDAGQSRCLVSWGGSMFEYLMPALFLKSQAGTLLAQSECAAVEAHKRFGRAQKVPWGVSESGFASLDADRNFRYRAFGVPGLGLRRDLAEDSVVAPYATLLALGCDVPAAIANLRELISLGMMGEYGLYEAADFTPERVPEGRRLSRVNSYMAHHQGMILAALDNALCEGALVRRVSSDPRVRSVELLLHERVPNERPPELLPRAALPTRRSPSKSLPLPQPWSPEGVPGSALHLLGNGRLSSSITATGGGGLRWQDYALTRWTPDPTCETQGLRFYVKDEETGEQWPAISASAEGHGEGAVLFHPHMAEFHQRGHGIGLRIEVVVVPGDDVEIRRITVVNETDRARVLTLTSYCEIVLARSRDDERHPAFSKLFVGSEWFEGKAGLLFTRRPLSSDDRPPVLFHRLVADTPDVSLIGFETDRGTFLGRGRDVQNPEGRVRSTEASTGFTLDAVASLCVRVELEPDQTQQLAFVTLAAGSRESALETAERYQTPGALEWVIADAAADASRQLQKVGIDGATLPALQRLASRLVYPNRALRCGSELLRENRLGQPRLWGMGLSGDLPILLLKTDEADEGELLRDLVAGHRIWREKGLAVDLVVLRNAASGYVEAVGERLLGVLQELGAREQLGRKGGIHFIVADQMPQEEKRLLQVAARVVLDAGGGPLALQLAAVEYLRPELPGFSPSRWEAVREPTADLERSLDLQFDNGFGGFSPDGRDYVIFLGPGESTPAPWSNVLANDGFGCLVTESGGGFTWAGNSGENRLSPWTNDPVTDAGGEALYLRDEETGVVWTPTPSPAGQEVSHEVRHTAGRTEWRSNAEGLEQTLQVFVPAHDPVKLIHLRIRNTWDRPRRLTATYYIEWVLGAKRTDTAAFLVSDFDPAARALFVRNPWAPEFADRVAFLASSTEPHGVSADREEFLGRDGSLRSPAALRRWGLSGRVEPGGDPCGALQVHLELQPLEEREVHFVVGQGRDRMQSLELLSRWRDPGAIAPAKEETQAFWDDLLDQIQVRTPDASLDLMLNRWLLYQTLASRLFARSGFYQSGGAIGFRDQLQDTLCLTHAAPERLRSQLLECAAHQFERGDVLHWWHPPSGRGVRTRCSDDLLWLPFAAAHYIETTGDLSILDEMIPFLDGTELTPDESERYALFARSARSGSLFEHCERALELGLTRGPHDLPLMGAGDWNDGMNRVGLRGRGESVWLGWFAIAAIRGFAKVCDRRGQAELATHWRQRMAELTRAVDEVGWDGDWYRRAIDDDGVPWGSHKSEECRIDSIAQSWSVLSRAAPESRARRALAAAEAELVQEEEGLVKLLSPPFDATLRDPGYIKSYPPGVRENGGQYTHAAAWLGWAFVELGEPERAMRILQLLNPIGHALDREAAMNYRVEPYVLAADIASVAPHVGRGGWTWYTGAASWTWRLGIEGILGIRRVEGGIRIEPCIPTNWGHAEVRVRGPAGTLVISIQDPNRVGRGIDHMELDGERIQDQIVKLPDDGFDHHVDVRLGH